MAISDLIKNDKSRLQILAHVAKLHLPDCWVAAGFVRNMVWDHLHGFAPTPLNDVDVIFFDREDDNNQMGKKAHFKLLGYAPDINWEVKNQAWMHLRNGDSPYHSSSDAMSYWPEIETAVGVRLVEAGSIEVCAPFGVDSLLSGYLSPNPKKSYALFQQRIHHKGWLERWPGLRLAPRYSSDGIFDAIVL